MKKAWESPKLIVLMRGQAEESILANCKTYEGPDHGPIDTAYY
jgi:hypothetical protein